MINSPKQDQNEAQAVLNNSKHVGGLNPAKDYVANRFEYLLTGEATIAFKPNLHIPKINDTSANKFEVTILLDKSLESTKSIIKAYEEMTKAVFGKKTPKNALIKDGDAMYTKKVNESEDEDLESVKEFYGKFQGHIYFTTKTNYNGYFKTGADGFSTDELLTDKQTKYRDINGEAISGECFEIGDTVRVDFLMYPYVRKDNTGISAQQNNVQLLVSNGGGSSDSEDQMGMGSGVAQSDEELFGM